MGREKDGKPPGRNGAALRLPEETVMNTNQTAKKAKFRARADGIDKNLSKQPSIVLGGKAWAPNVLAQVYRNWIAKADTADSADIAAAKARKERDDAEKALVVIDRDFQAYVEALHGRTSATLNDYAFKPARKRRMKVKDKAQAQEKAKATREARHTMGKRQKSRIRGEATKGNGAQSQKA
jgi:hypothetical protein